MVSPLKKCRRSAGSSHDPNQLALFTNVERTLFCNRAQQSAEARAASPPDSLAELRLANQVDEHLARGDALEGKTLFRLAEEAQTELEVAEKTLKARTEILSGPATNWQHLARVAVILSRHPDLSGKDAFLEAAAVLQEELGLRGDDPGNAIWRGVQRLGKRLLRTEHLPDHYLQFEGFRRLVFDLVRDTA